MFKSNAVWLAVLSRIKNNLPEAEKKFQDLSNSIDKSANDKHILIDESAHRQHIHVDTESSRNKDLHLQEIVDDLLKK